MTDDEPIELEVGEGPSVFHDLGDPNAETKLLKAQLAGEILDVLNRRKLSTRAAEELTGVAAADIARIRSADLGRFTIDRLVRVLSRLDRRVELKVSAAKRGRAA